MNDCLKEDTITSAASAVPKIAGGLMVGVLALLFSLPSGSFAQMPDWKMINDRDGNKYFTDKNGKLYVPGKPDLNFKPVAAEGIDFYLSQGEELINNHYKAEGLTVLKSILALPQSGGRIVEAQEKASRRINSLSRAEGDRFKALNEEASLLVCRSGNEVFLANDRMRYGLRIKGSLKVIRRRVRNTESYSYHGVLAGINFSSGTMQTAEPAGAYDVLLAIDSEYFPQAVKSVSRLEENWRKNIGPDSLTRVVVEKNDALAVYSFDDTRGPYYSGIEAFVHNGRYGHCLRAISTQKKFPLYRDSVLQIIKNFSK